MGTIAVRNASDEVGTTVALGLACELGRADGPAVAVDVDRRHPRLHRVAGVDREPTLAALERGGDVTDAAQPVAGHPRVGVLPAPAADDPVDVGDRLRTLAASPVDVVIDCPPDADAAIEDALAVADERLVVTLDANTDVASATVRPSLPAAAPPSTATGRKAKSYAISTVNGHSRMVGRLATGIDVLDRKLDGGVPPGSVVAFTARPASQSELLLYELTAVRGTLYLTSERSIDAVHHALETSPSTVGNPTVRRVDDRSPLEEATRLVGALPDGANLVVDTVDPLERTATDDYVSFLNGLKDRMLETDSVAVLHCLKGDDVPANRTRTLHAADAVFDLRTDVSGTELENTLSIPKFRGGRQPTETIKLELTEAVEIDTSRDIA